MRGMRRRPSVSSEGSVRTSALTSVEVQLALELVEIFQINIPASVRLVVREHLLQLLAAGGDAVVAQQALEPRQVDGT